MLGNNAVQSSHPNAFRINAGWQLRAKPLVRHQELGVGNPSAIGQISSSYFKWNSTTHHGPKIFSSPRKPSGNCSRLSFKKEKGKKKGKNASLGIAWETGISLIYSLVLPFKLLTTSNMIYILKHDPGSAHTYTNI